MHVKEQGLVKLRSQLGICGNSVGVVTGWLVWRDCGVVSVAPGDCPIGSIQPDSPVEKSREFHFRVSHLQHGHCWRNPSETLRDRRSPDERWDSLHYRRRLELNYPNWDGWIVSKDRFCSLETWRYHATHCAVCHRSLVNVARLQSFVEGPWKTHKPCC